MDKHELLIKIEWNFQVMGLDIFVSVKQNIMGILVVSNLLLLLGYVDSNLDCLLHISNSSVKFESPLRLFRDVVSLSHQVVHELMSQSVNLYLANHVNHVWNAALSLTNVKLQSFLIVVTLFVVSGCFSPLRNTFKELGNLEMLLHILLINFCNNLGILIHLLMRLSNDICLISSSSSH